MSRQSRNVRFRVARGKEHGKLIVPVKRRRAMLGHVHASLRACSP